MTTPHSWTARVDWLSHAIGEDLVDELDHVTDKLADHSPAAAIEFEPEGAGFYPTHLSVTFTLTDVSTLRQATTEAMRALEQALPTGHRAPRATGVEVLTTDEYDRRVAEPVVPDLVGNAEIADMLGVTRQRASQLTALEGFPPAVVALKAGPLRIRSQVDAWAGTWERQVGRPKKTARDGGEVEPTTVAVAARA